MKPGVGAKDSVHTIGLSGLAHKAAVVAAKAHANLESKTLKAPYIAHPVRVALFLSLWFGVQDDEVIAAALLHDVVEKSPWHLNEIESDFGPRVAEWVDLLTRRKDMSKSDYLARLKSGPHEARLIKIADVLDHLDCDVEELPSRLESAEEARSLLHGSEPAIQTAAGWLREALARSRKRFEEID